MHGYDTYDYGKRHYLPTLGSFMSMDFLCEKYYSISPYAYCANNPVRFVDFDGMQASDTITSGKMLPEIVIIGKKVAEPVSGFWGNISYFLFGRTYNAPVYGVTNSNLSAYPIGYTTFNVDRNGYVTNLVPMGGVAPLPTSKNPVAIKDIFEFIKSVRDLRTLKALIKDLSKPGSELKQQDLDALREVVKQYGGQIRVDLQEVKGAGTSPHVHVEGLGRTIESRHIWIEPNVK